MVETVRKCRSCGAPYHVYSMCAGDQSICPACREARDSALRQSAAGGSEEQKARRVKAFGGGGATYD